MRAMVERKLKSIIGRLEGGRRIGRHRDTLVYAMYAYGHETALVVAGLGLSDPVVHALAAEGANGGGVQAAGLFEALAVYPLPLMVLSGTLLLFWAITRVLVNLGGLSKKVPLYQACRRELGKLESDLDAALSRAQPLDELTQLQSSAKEIVDRYYQVDGWPWPIEPPSAEASVAARLAALCDKYEDHWDQGPLELQQREPVPAGGGA